MLLVVLSSAHLEAFTPRATTVNKSPSTRTADQSLRTLHPSIFGYHRENPSLLTLRAGATNGADNTPTIVSKVKDYVNKNFFLVGMFVAGIAMLIVCLAVREMEINIKTYDVCLQTSLAVAVAVSATIGICG